MINGIKFKIDLIVWKWELEDTPFDSVACLK